MDFDFFSEKPLDRDTIKASFSFIGDAVTIQDSKDTWVVLVPVDGNGHQHVKLSFFGSITFGRIGDPSYTSDGVLQVASLEDLMATKLKVILQRAEYKDYCDIAAMLKAGGDLARGLAGARVLYGPNFQPAESLKALTFFGDGDLNLLSTEERKILVDAAKSVRRLPVVELISESLSGRSWDELCAEERDSNRASEPHHQVRPTRS